MFEGSFSTAKPVKWLKARKIPWDFLNKKGLLFPFYDHLLYACAPGSGAHDALKIVLVVRAGAWKKAKPGYQDDVGASFAIAHVPAHEHVPGAPSARESVVYWYSI